ncbi:sigma-70 family RNA polymerase sigma factor [Micromonospora sp. KC606]|uniref:RNA polymerase sigma factor n=1 Tax=Micromonospora sp. KC606 TaxID=2530379 RepID=UPI0010511806|nr:sigma-70 family RNA polymerase sigma factor [Micromonospora sp. KC606]TDC83787.1 sigma-70 family RNA polymerase sigma factor [Micromonospora sp. KC606]
MQSPEGRMTDLFGQHADDVHAYARWRVGDDEAGDVVGEVFLAAWRSLASLRPGEERAWLFGTARRVVLSRRRQGAARSALTHRLTALHDRAPADGMAEQVALTDRVRQVLDLLSDADREALVIASWFDLSPVEAAKALGVSRPTYAVRLHRARKRFRAAFHRMSPDRPAELPDGAYPTPAREGAR